MTSEEFDRAWSDFMLDEAYAEFIMTNAKGDRVICNGSLLLDAMEDEYLFEDFRKSLVKE